MSEIVDFEEDLGEEEYSGFRIEDDKTAEWAMAKIREAEDNTAMWEAHFKGQLRRIKETNEHTVATMKAFLRDYFAKVPHKITKTEENYRLPSGKLVLKHRNPDLEMDEEKLLEWVRKEHPEYIKRVESVDWGNFKKTLKIAGETVTDEDGVIVPYIKAVERPDEFTIGK